MATDENLFVPVPIHLRNPPVASCKYLRSRHIQSAQCQGNGHDFADVFAAAQKGRKSWQFAAGEGQDQYWRSRSANFPAWDRSHMRFLRVFVCR